MRFTPSANWSLIVASANKIVGWTTYIRTVTNLSGSNSGTGGWLNVSSLTVPPVPDQTTSIEKDFLEFSSSSISIVAMNISWWTSQVFTPADRKDATKFFEFKIVCALSSGSIVASDECLTFAGWVNKDSIRLNETDDSVLFEVMSYDDMATLLPADGLTTQYIDSNVPGLLGTKLLSLYNIAPAYIRDANLASYPLLVGYHSINYEYNTTSRQMNLDDGPWVGSGAGSDFTLVSPDGLQKVRMYVPDWSVLPTPSGTIYGRLTLRDTVVVTNPAGATLPNNWHRNATTYQILGQCFNAIGITSQHYDTMEFPFWDGRTDVSYLGLPPDDPSNATPASAACVVPSDGSIYVAIGLKVYKRAAGAPYGYTLICTSTALSSIARLLYNASNGYLWMVGSNGRTALWNGSSLVDNMGTAVYTPYACTVIANKNSVMIYLDGAGGLKQVDSSGTITSIAVATYAPEYWLDSDGTSRIFFSSFLSASHYINMQTWNGAAWVDNGARASTVGGYSFLSGAYSVADDAVYYDSPSGSNVGLNCAKPIVGGPGGTSSSVTSPTIWTLNDYFYNGNDSKVYVLGISSAASPQPATLYTVQLVGGVPTLAAQDQGSMPLIIGLTYGGRSLGFGNSRLFGLNVLGQLWQYANVYALSITEAAFPDGTVKNIIDAVCRACNLAYIVTPQKSVSIYRRFDQAGDPITSGNTIQLNSTIASGLNGPKTYVRAIAWFEVNNGAVSHKYNGTGFDLGTLGSDRSVTLQNTLVPSILVKDTAYYGYVYLQQDRLKYRVECGIYPAFQWEPFDAAALSFSGKIQVSTSGVIYASTCQSDGTLVLDVIV